MIKKNLTNGEYAVTYQINRLEAIEKMKNEKLIQDDKIKNELIRKGLPDFNLKDINGLNVSNRELIGKTVVINFWFTSCSPCIQEMPELNKLALKYKNNPNVIFLAPSFENPEQVKKFLLKKDFDFKILTNSKDFDEKLGISRWPTTLILDKNSEIKEVIIGRENEIFEKLDNILLKMQ
jgi:thiol-disulfide isomerase/thioredoxin